jgi:hypothetical protein
MKIDTNITIGTVSHGTLRPQDLIPSFLDAIREYAPAEYAGMMSAAFGPVPSYVMDEGDSSPWWDSEDAAYLLENLFSILDSVAPDGMYFGAHYGDGSDFGFWEVCED